MVTLPTPGRKADIMKKSVLVVFGGQSSEHIVSCMSAINVIKNIDTERYDVTLIGITEEGKWLPVSYTHLPAHDGRRYAGIGRSTESI